MDNKYIVECCIKLSLMFNDVGLKHPICSVDPINFAICWHQKIHRCIDNVPGLMTNVSDIQVYFQY